MERAAILSQGSVLELGPDVVRTVAPSGGFSPELVEKPIVIEAVASPPPGSSTLEEIERNHIVAILNQTGGIVEGQRGAAKILGLHPNTLRHRMQKLGLRRSAYRES
jgi:formate hydrogenlyase transcriptional activator